VEKHFFLSVRFIALQHLLYVSSSELLSTKVAEDPQKRVNSTAYPKAVADLKAAGALPEHVALRQVKYLNNLIEQDHRFIQPFSDA